MPSCDKSISTRCVSRRKVFFARHIKSTLCANMWPQEILKYLSVCAVCVCVCVCWDFVLLLLGARWVNFSSKKNTLSAREVLPIIEKVFASQFGKHFCLNFPDTGNTTISGNHTRSKQKHVCVCVRV